jgi:serine/threonine-protein kinase
MLAGERQFEGSSPMSEDEASQPTPSDGSETAATKGQPTAPGPPPAADETVVVPKASGPSGTSVMPAVPADAPRWSARAQVRPAGVEEDSPSAWEDEEAAPPGRGLFGPVLISLTAVVVLGLIAAAVLLFMRDDNEPVTPPTATRTASPSPSATPSPSAAPTSTPPTSAVVTSISSAPIEIPPVTGSTFDAASTALRGLGLRVRRINQASDTVPEGQVIETNPPAGTLVLPGFPVDVVVSTGPASVPTTTTTSPPN